MKTTILKLGVFFLAASLTFTSCKKDEDKADREEAAKLVEDNASAQSAFDNIFNAVDDNMSSQSDETNRGNRDVNTGCPTVTAQWTDGILTSLVIDYGDTYCTPVNSTDQIKGKIIVSASGRYRTPGSSISVILEDFYFNQYHVEGTKTVTNQGYDTDSILNYTFVVEGGKLTAPNGEFSSWETNQTRRWLQGESSWWWPFDDVYEITGTASGVNAGATPYTITVNDPLWVRVGCRFVQQGSLTVANDNISVGVDYGTYQTNVCDRSVTYTVNGTNYTQTVN
jgi:hypothetical protein